MEKTELQQLFSDSMRDKLLRELNLINLVAAKELSEGSCEHIIIKDDACRKFFKGMWLIVSSNNEISIVDNPQRPTRTESKERFQEYRYSLEKFVPEISGFHYTEKEILEPQHSYYLT